MAIKILFSFLATILGITLQAQQAGDIDLSYGDEGTAEYTFTIDGVLNGVTIHDIHLLPNGKLLAVGWTKEGCSGFWYERGVILRLNNDGSLDTSFQEGGYGLYGESGFFQIVPETNNSFFVVGNDKLRKIDSDGNLDMSFGVEGAISTNMQIREMALGDDGRIILGGRIMNTAGKWELTVSKREVDGALDTSFGSDGYFVIPHIELNGNTLHDVQLDSQNRIIIVGHREQSQNDDSMLIVRLTPNGNTDTTFASDGVYVDTYHNTAKAMTVYIEDDGKLLIVGHGQESSFGLRGMILSRLHADGSLDVSYASNGRAFYHTYSDSIPDVIHAFEGGYVISGDSSNTVFIAKVNVDGSLRTEFGGTGYILYNPFDFSGFSKTSIIEGNRLILSSNEYFDHCAQSKYRAQFTRIFLNDDGLPVTAFQADNLEKCDDNNDGTEFFDLTQNDTTILSGQMGVQLTYHLNEVDANSGANLISDPSAFMTNVSPQLIYARVEDDGTGEYDTTSFSLQFNPTPTPLENVSLEICAPFGVGFGEFFLPEAINTIANGDNEVEISFFGTVSNAEQNINELQDTYQNDDPYVDVVWAKAIYPTTGCYAIVEVALLVNDEPEIPTDVEDIVKCNEQVFDLTERSTEIFGNQSETEFTLTFYESFSDAEIGANSILDASAYTSAGDFDIIYARLENNETGCFGITDFDLIVGDASITVQPIDIFVIEDFPDGVATFDLTENETIILNGQLPSDYDVAFFETENDAIAYTNVISNPETYQNESNPQEIFIRKTQLATQCFDVSTFEIETNSPLVVDENAWESVKIYPNPANNIIYIYFSSFSDNPTMVSIFSVEGKLICSKPIQQSVNVTSMSLSLLPTGTYFIKVQSDNNSLVKKFLKE